MFITKGALEHRVVAFRETDKAAVTPMVMKSRERIMETFLVLENM